MRKRERKDIDSEHQLCTEFYFAHIHWLLTRIYSKYRGSNQYFHFTDERTESQKLLVSDLIAGEVKIKPKFFILHNTVKGYR